MWRLRISSFYPRMTRKNETNNKTFQFINILAGVLTLAGVIFDFILFENVKYKMVGFIPLTHVGRKSADRCRFQPIVDGRLFTLSLLQIITSIRQSESLNFSKSYCSSQGWSLCNGFRRYLFAAGYRKPIWSGLISAWMDSALSNSYPARNCFLVFVLLHFAGYFNKEQAQTVAVDSNIFMIVQYTGLVSGGMGLAFAILGFIFPKGWSHAIHTIVTNLILILPYGLAILYWFVVKTHDKGQPLFDEKQRQDVGWSAFMTLLIVSAMMVFVFIINIHSLDAAIGIYGCRCICSRLPWFFPLGTCTLIARVDHIPVCE